MKISLWEILVPTETRVERKPIRLRFHRVWDAKVRAISRGLTILPPVIGEWIPDECTPTVRERMIPVRFLATQDQADEICKMTLKYYDQDAVLCYRISDDVILLERD